MSSTVALHQIFSVSFTSSLSPGLTDVTLWPATHSLYFLILSYQRSNSSGSPYSFFASAIILTELSIIRESYRTFLLIFLRQDGHSFLRTKHSEMHWWQNEWPHTAILHATIKSMQMGQVSPSTFLNDCRAVCFY